MRTRSIGIIRLSPAASYAVAAGMVALAGLLRVALVPLWGDYQLPFITFFPAVMLAGWVGGFAPGLAATALSALAVNWFWIEPRHSLNIHSRGDAVGLLAFVAISLLITGLNALWRRDAGAATRLAEAERTAREQLTVALEAGRMGTWEYAIGPGTVRWSPGLEAIHGYEPGRFPGTFEAFRNEIHPDDRAGVLAAIGAAVEQRRDHHIEYRIVRADGAVRWVEGRGRVYLDAAGRPERMLGVCVDVTERRQSEDTLRLAIEAAPTAMLIVDQRGAIMLVNGLTERLLGYDRGELVGAPIDRLVPERLREGHAGHRAAFFRDPRQRPMGAGRELFARRKDDTEVAVEIGLSPIETANGTLVIAAVTDITERRRTLAAERQAVQAAEAANRAKDEFLAVLSHELRTPLSTITSWAAMLRSGGLPAERAEHALEVIERNARMEARLVDSLLDVSRIVTGKLDLVLGPVDLGAVVETAVESCLPAARDKDIRVEVEVPPAPVRLTGDDVRLQQVVANLVSNAVKFTPRRGHVRVTLATDGGGAAIRISDNGDGIAADFLPFLFDRFRQAETARQRAHGGLGLGLAIVRELVQAHGGTVAAASDGPGQGATFTVLLPISPAISGEFPAAPGAAASGDESEPALDGLRVLVVDDDADTRELLAVTLEARGARVRTAAASAEALELLEREPGDVLIADIGMPREDGFTLLQKLRAREKYRGLPRLPAIALTAYVSVMDREQGATVGYDLHLAKPVNAADLTRALAKVRNPAEA